MEIEDELRKEIEKWSKKLDASLQNVHPLDEKGNKMLQNIKAYHDDSKHFLKRGDLVKSFECLVWAWAILEISKDLKFIE